jgi:hypothetical protein
VCSARPAATRTTSSTQWTACVGPAARLTACGATGRSTAVSPVPTPSTAPSGPTRTCPPRTAPAPSAQTATTSTTRRSAAGVCRRAAGAAATPPTAWTTCPPSCCSTRGPSPAKKATSCLPRSSARAAT